MVALDVELQPSAGKKVKRSFLVPLNIPFGTLHIILQIGFGWYNSHLHKFSNEDRTITIGPKLEDIGIEQVEDMQDEKETMLADVIPKLKRIEYLYDFGDSWEHIIKVGKVKTVDEGPYAECTGGEGSTPPEDCGGALGYERLCEILSDPTHEEYEEMLGWAGDDFDVGFDQDFINEELGKLQFIHHSRSS